MRIFHSLNARPISQPTVFVHLLKQSQCSLSSTAKIHDIFQQPKSMYTQQLQARVVIHVQEGSTCLRSTWLCCWLTDSNRQHRISNARATAVKCE